MLRAILKVASVITGRRYRRPVNPELSVLGIRTGQKPIRHRHFQRRVPTMFSSLVRDHLGALKHGGLPHPNLRTNDGIDWQSALMADFGRNFLGAVTATTATSVSKTGAGMTTDAYKGHLVVEAASNTVKYGVILTNSATVLTIDGWYDSAGFGASTPGSGNNFYILPGGAPAIYMALSTDSGAPAVTDTTLTSEITTGGLARAQPTSFAHTAATSTYSLSKTFTATSTFTVNKAALFNAQNGGYMPFESAEPNPPTVVSGDTLQQTATVTYT